MTAIDQADLHTVVITSRLEETLSGIVLGQLDATDERL